MSRTQQITLAGIVLLLAACFLAIRRVIPPDPTPLVERTPRPTQAKEIAKQEVTPGERISPEHAISQLNTELSQQRSDHYDYEAEAVDLLLQWAESDPEAALRHSLKPLEDDNISSVFLTGADEVIAIWTRRSPETARRFLQSSVSNPAVIRQLAPAVMREYARLKPSEAIAWVTFGISSDSDELRPALALELVKTFDDNGRRAEIQAWLNRPEIATTAFVGPSVAEFAARLAAENAHVALQFASNLPEGSMSRGLAWKETLRQWTSRDPQAAHAFLASMVRGESATPGYTSAELDYAIAGYAVAIAKPDRAGAVETVASIQDPSLRETILRKVQAGSAEARAIQ